MGPDSFVGPRHVHVHVERRDAAVLRGRLARQHRGRQKRVRAQLLSKGQLSRNGKLANI